MLVKILRNKIFEFVKNKKNKKMKDMYYKLIENEEYIDLIMTKLGNEIERLFPDLKFRLIGRIKSEKSFIQKLENALNKCEKISQIKEVKIYDIIGLNVVVEDVPEYIISETFKKSKSYNNEFDLKISEMIEERENKKIDIKILKKVIKTNVKELKKIKSYIRTKTRKIEQLEKEEKTTILNSVINDYKEDIKNYNMQIQKERGVIEGIKQVLENDKNSYEDKINDCNHEVAKFIVSKLTDFEEIKKINLKSIKNRFKIFDKDNGYKSVHNCFKMPLRRKNKYICEIQGKSIRAYNQANNGIAAKYHTNPEQKPGKKLKCKDLPDIFSIKTVEEKEQFLKEVKRNVPRFRVYDNSNGKSGIYKLSLRECYILYYYNQLYGNEVLGIEKNENQINELVKTQVLPDDEKYNKYRYNEVIMEK